MEITYEHLQQLFDNQLTKIDVLIDRKIEFKFQVLESKLETLIDAKLKAFEERFEAKIDAKLDAKLDALEKRITQAYQEFTIQAIEAHQIWVTEHFKDWMMPYDIRLSRVEVRTQHLP